MQCVKNVVDPTGHFVLAARKVCDPRREIGVMERLLWLWMVLFLWMGVALAVDGTAMTVGSSVITTEFGMRTLLLRHAVATQMSYSRLRGRFQQLPRWSLKVHEKKWRHFRRNVIVTKNSGASVTQGWRSLSSDQEEFDDVFHMMVQDVGFANEFDALCIAIPNFADCLTDNFLGLQEDNDRVIHPCDVLCSDGSTVLTARQQLSEIITAEGMDDVIKMKGLFLSQTNSPIVFDCGASLSVSFAQTDFVGEIKPVKDQTLGELTSEGEIAGVGTIRYEFRDDFGRRKHVENPGYYIPAARIKLFSMQTYFMKEKGGAFSMDENGVRFVFAEGGTMSFGYASGSNLPIAYPDGNVASRGPTSLPTVVDNVNINLTAAQKELLKWHWKLGHFNCQWIQTLMRCDQTRKQPVIATKHTKASSCQPPVCAACQAGKQARRPSGAKHVKDRHVMKMKQDHLSPGQVISCDQYVSALKGRLPNSRGREKPHMMSTGGTIFVDHASGLVFVENQVSLMAGDTIRAKRNFENFARTCGVNIEQYRGDNGVFKAKDFVDECEIRSQKIDFSGVGAHHQNGVAERAIKMIIQSARTMLLHASIHWPDEADLMLWPFALEHAVHLWNHTPLTNLLAWHPLICSHRLNLIWKC